MHSLIRSHSTVSYTRRNTYLIIALFLLFFTSCLFFSPVSTARASDLSEFLVELGVKYFERGNYTNALHEFNKALMLDPNNKTAQQYIKTIEDSGLEIKPDYLPLTIIEPKDRERVINVALDTFDEVLVVKEQEDKDVEPSKFSTVVVSKKQRKALISDALDEFSKVRFVRDKSVPTVKPSKKKAPAPSLKVTPREDRDSAIHSALDEFEAEYGSIEARQIRRPVPAQRREPRKPSPLITTDEDKAFQRLTLDDTVRATQPQTIINLQIDRDLVITGNNIARYLVVDPEILKVERVRPNEIKLIAQKIGSTYLHIWDDNGRWTFIVRVSPFRSGRPTLAELYRQRAEEAGSFKLHYHNEWVSFNSGPRVDDLKRDSYSFYQSFGFDGQTPYGDLDGRVQLNRLNEESEFTYYTLGLENGVVGPFKGFDVRAFDYYVDFNNIAFGGATLRGGKLYSPAFNEKVNYTVFWGKEQEGVFSPLAPGLSGERDAFLQGVNVSLTAPDNLRHTVSYFKGYGSDRSVDLKPEAYDYTAEANLGALKLSSDVAHDGDSLAYLLRSAWTIPKFQLTTEFRNIEDDFYALTGRPYASGELGGLVTYRYSPSRDFDISGRVNAYRDRLFPNPEHPKRFNVDADTSMRYVFNPTTSMRLDYYNNHDTGTISPHKGQSGGLTFYKQLDFIKKLNTFISFRHQTSENINTPTLDYTNEKVTAGLRVGLTDHLNYFVSKEFNWLEEYDGDVENPHVLTTGLDYRRQLFDTPLYFTSRLYFRDEENTTSTRSFLAGEDNLEGQVELRYQPSEDFGTYANVRVNNIWAENPDVSERVEAEVRFGAQMTFDTHVRWNPIGSITGVVFKDLNSDNIRQSDEVPMKDIKITLGKDKYDVTDSEGAYIFKNIRARKAYVYLDMDTLPSGYVLTGSDSREVIIENGKLINVDFGIVARSEIYGIVFKDVNNNGTFDLGDTGVSEVVISLEDGTSTTTNARGQYYLRGIAPGKHTVTLDINSLPIHLIPQVPIYKEIELFEGVTYVHNIPLKEVQQP
ncbi:SdrD B-like domain-containing protein [Candidatus Omnitrophota bacterium]